MVINCSTSTKAMLAYMTFFTCKTMTGKEGGTLFRLPAGQKERDSSSFPPSTYDLESRSRQVKLQHEPLAVWLQAQALSDLLQCGNDSRQQHMMSTPCTVCAYMMCQTSSVLEQKIRGSRERYNGAAYGREGYLQLRDLRAQGSGPLECVCVCETG